MNARRNTSRLRCCVCLAALVFALPGWAAVTPTGTVVTVGGDPADDGPVAPTPGDLLVPVSDLILVGDLSSLIIDGSSFVQAGGIATDILSTGSTITITGTGTRVEALGTGARFSLSGVSTASILDGAVFDASDTTGCTASGSCVVTIGAVSGSDATLTVSGAGSVLDATAGPVGSLVVGIANVAGTPVADAVGRLIVEDGGVVNAAGTAFAQGTFGGTTPVSRGFLEVRNAGSQFNASSIILGNNFAPVDNGVASITVEDQGAVSVLGAVVAGLGDNTDATISVTTGATFDALAVYGSRGTASVSDISFDGAGTVATIGDELVIGQGSASNLSITNGAVVNIGGGTETGFIGSSLTLGTQGGTGTGLIDNATVTIGPNTDMPEVRLSIGVLGTGDLTIQNGASVTVQDLTGGLGIVGDGVTVGESAPGIAAAGTLVVQGAGTNLTIDSIDGSALVAGIATNGVDAATGSIDILDGATVSISGTGLNSGINLGRGGNSSGTLNVSGSGTSLDVTGPQGIIAIASNFGGAVGDTDARMTVTDGARVTLAGLTPGQGFFSVGNGAGNGELEVNTGGAIDIDGFLRISVDNANGNTQTGLVTVSDTGTINTTNIEIGNRGLLTGNGTVTADVLDVLSGGSVDLESLDGIGTINLSGGSYSAPAGAFDIGARGDQTFNLTNGGTLSAPAEATVGGSGFAGALAISGSGSLFDAGGDVTVNDRLSLDAGGRLQSTGDVLIADGGFLFGDGGTLAAVRTTVGTGGRIGPGNSPGTLDITGDFTLDGGTLEFEFAGFNPGEFDVINVDGNVDLLSGTVSVALLDGFNPGGRSFDVLSATGVLSVSPGVTFLSSGPGPDFEFSTRSDGGIDYGTITFTARDVATATGLSILQQNTAVYLDAVCPRVEGLTTPSADALDLDMRCGNLRSSATADAQVANALEQMTPDEVVGTFTGLVRLAPLQHGNLARRLNGLRSGSSRVDIGNLNIVTENAQVSGEALQDVLEKLSQQEFGRWGFFSEGRVNFGERGDTRRSPGYDFNTTALTVGTDYKLRDNLFLGAAVGYNESDADYDVGGGAAMQSYSLSLLGTYFRGDSFYVDSLVTYASTDIETDRRIVYEDFAGAVDRKARGDTDGDQWAFGLGSGFDFTRGRWVWGPHAGVNYSDTRIDGFHETGAGGLNLAMPDTAYRSLTANAGLHASVTLTPSWGVVVPYAQVDFVREYKNGSESERIRFVQDTFSTDPTNPTAPLTVENGGIDANHLSWAIGVHLQLINGIAGFIDYRGTSGLQEFDVHEIAAGLRFERRLP